MKQIGLKISISLFLFLTLFIGVSSIREYFDATSVFDQVFFVIVTMLQFALFSVIGVKALMYFKDAKLAETIEANVNDELITYGKKKETKE